MTDQLKKITDSLKELESMGYFEFRLIDHNHVRDRDKEESRIKFDKYNYKVFLSILETDSLEDIASNISSCYEETKKMENLYLHNLKSPDLWVSLNTWAIKRK